MFSNLRKKIIRYILLTSILFTFIIGAVSFYFVNQSIYRNFVNAADENIIQSIKNSSFSIEAAKSATVQISSNTQITDALDSIEYNPQITPILNTIKNTSFGILGVTIYTPHQTYTTSSISLYPAFSELIQDPEISSFIESKDNIYLSIRTHDIAQIYNHVRYDSNYGIMTYIVKLFNSKHEISGYLFLDLNPSYIYHNFFSYSNYHNFKNVKSYIITTNGTYLKSEQNNTEYAKYIKQVQVNQIKRSEDHKVLLISKPLYNEETKIVSVIPLNGYFQNILWLGLALFLSILALNIVSYLIASKLSKNMITSLTDLHQKMNETNLK